MEFLGDSVLELAIAKELYDRYPDASEGRLAKIRSHVVSRQSCAAVARELRLGERLGEAAGEALAGDELSRIVKSGNVTAALLEEHAGREACNASDEQIAAILELHAQMRGHYERRERPEYFRVNQEIHNAIVRAAGNPTLAMLHGILRTRMRRLRYIGNQSPDNWSAAMGEHEAFIDALRARDGERLGRLMREHLANTWPRIESAVGSFERGV